MAYDPVNTDPELYHVICENERVRVLGYGTRRGQGLAAPASGQRHVHAEICPAAAHRQTGSWGAVRGGRGPVAQLMPQLTMTVPGRPDADDKAGRPGRGGSR
jgi:hypothetical protein